MSQLENGSKVAVVGGGPAGSFFSIFALKMAKMVGKDISVTIFEPKDFTKDGPAGCNRCGGVISELLVETLAIEGINLPDTVVQRGINSYRLHTEFGSVSIATPGHENRIATVYRGGGPRGIVGSDKESFDRFLLNTALVEGACHEPVRIDRIGWRNSRPVLYSGASEVCKADLVTGAVGVNSSSPVFFEGAGFGYRKPDTMVAAMAEIAFDKRVMSEQFGSAIHLFLLPVKDIKFAAIIPKGTYVTVCILGKNVRASTVRNFLDYPVVRDVFPASATYEISCQCLPKMNIRAPRVPFSDRIVMCGDAGSTRLYKDGIGAAYIMGKAAAKTAVLYGISKEHFREFFSPVYRSIINDNRYGSILFALTDICRMHPSLGRGMLGVVRKEQGHVYPSRRLSAILWGMFTGNERYKTIFGESVNLPLHVRYWMEVVRNMGGRSSEGE